jgi:hypothetical protein
MPDQQVGFVLAGATVMYGARGHVGRALGWARAVRAQTRRHPALYHWPPSSPVLIVPQLSFALVGFFGRAFFSWGSFNPQ